MMAGKGTKAKGVKHGRLIKYLGSSHVRRLEAGEDFAGRLGDPLESAVEWNLANNHIVDASDVGLSDDAIDLLLTQEGDMFDSGQYETDEDGDVVPTDENTVRTMHEFIEVTDASKIPPSLAQSIFLGLGQHQSVDEAVQQMENLSGKTDTGASSPTAGATSAAVPAGGGGPATTVGGSTGGAGGDVGAATAT